MNNLAEITPRFKDIDSALRYAFSAERKTLRPRPCMAPISAKEPFDNIYNDSEDLSDLDTIERLTDAGMIKACALEAAGHRGHHLIIARYSWTEDKHISIEALRGYIYQKKPTITTDKNFVEDIIRGWCDRPHHNLAWWSKHLSIAYSTLHTWAYSKNPKDKSITLLLNNWLIEAKNRVTVVFHERGLL